MTDFRDRILHDHFCRCRACKKPFPPYPAPFGKPRWDRITVAAAALALFVCALVIAKAAL